VASSYGGARDRIERICAATTDARALRLEVLAGIRRTIGFDAYAWLLTDPETCVGAAPLADVPCLPELPRLIRLKYLTATNRWTALATGGVATLGSATAGDLTRSRLWRELLSTYGVTDVASTVFRDPYGCWGFLDLWRIGWRTGASAFTAAQAAWLAEVVPVITTALRRSQAATFAASAPAAGDGPGPIVLLLSADLRLLAQTPETDAHLRMLVPPDGATPPVPAGAYNVAAQLLAVEEGVDTGPPTARVHLAGSRWLTLRAARIAEPVSTSDGTIAVTLEQTAPQERLALFSRAAGLTARETELLRHLATGTDTRELAGRLSVSRHTVQDHLKSIFAKTSTRTRRALLSRALGS
jgi:DNA-binding CsgD family transcriptional regulator